MPDTVFTSTIPSNLNEQVNCILTLCSDISQVTSRIRLKQISSIEFSKYQIEKYYEELLSMIENIEGSAILLESLIELEKQNSSTTKPKWPRHRYTRDQLLKLRGYVTPDLSNHIKTTLRNVIQHESKNKLGKISRVNAEIILM